MKVGFLQCAPAFHNLKSTRTRIRELLEGADADLMVLPELTISGYLFKDAAEAAACSERVPGPSTEFFGDLAAANNTHYIYGFIEAGEDGLLYNSAACVFPDRSFRVYRKAHLFNREKLVFTPGNSQFEVFEINGVKIGMLICFDHMFPEAARTLALQGVEVICHPSNLVLEGLAQVTSRSRAIENRIFWILANRIGSEVSGTVSCTFTGGSQICAPTGEILAAASREEELLGIREIDPASAQDKQIGKRNDLFKDRRRELYQR